MDCTMTSITRDSVPRSCCIHKASVSIGSVVVYTVIFVSPGEEGEFVLGRPFVREALLLCYNKAEGRYGEQ